MLLMDKPRRLSTEIDIIVESGTDLDDYLENASAIFPIQMVEEQTRVGRNNIEKRHFKFIYDSPINNKQFYILLGVLFENNHYAEVVTKEIRNDLLLTDTEFEKVEDFREYANQKLIHEKLLPLRYLKKANPEAYAYVVKTDEIMK